MIELRSGHYIFDLVPKVIDLLRVANTTLGVDRLEFDRRSCQRSVVVQRVSLRHLDRNCFLLRRRDAHFGIGAIVNEFFKLFPSLVLLLH